MDALSAVHDMMGDVGLATDSERALVGRDAELARLVDLLGVGDARYRVPGNHVVLLAGDAGIGKTRLLTELRDVAFTKGWQVVAGHCLDFADSALPYLPFSEILGRLARDLPEVVGKKADAYPALARLLPGRRMLSERSTEAAALERGDLFEAVHALLEDTAALAPLLVVVEDLHWADQSTRDMLSFLFARPFASPVALVASYRSDDLHRRHPLRRQVAEWARIDGVERLHLEPLSEPDVRQLVRQLYPSPMREPEIADIVKRAEGNAFFVEELVGAASVSGHGVSGDLADVLLVRVDRLDESAQRVVRIAAVGGRRVSHALLAEVSGLTPAALEEALRAAVEANILVPTSGDSYAFRHTLLAEAVYDDLLPGERVRLHAAYAQVLRERRVAGTAAELARHARLGQDIRTGLLASIEAGNEAMRVGGPDEAAHHFQEAISLLTDPAVGDLDDIDVPTLVIKAADALTAAGHVPRAVALLREQLACLPTDASTVDRGRLLSALAHGLTLTETTEDPVAYSREAVELVADGPEIQRTKVLASHARILLSYRHVEEARQAGLEALALARRLDLPRLASDAVTTLAGLKKHGPVDQVRDAMEAAAEQAAQSGAVTAEIRALYLLGRFHQDLGEFDDAGAAFVRATDRATGAGRPWAPYAFESRFMHAQILYITGDWDAVLSRVSVAGQAPPPLTEAALGTIKAMVLAGRGDPGALDLARHFRPLWSKDGLIAIFGATAELDVHNHAVDLGAAVKTYDDVVSLLSATWRELFQARLRLAATVLGVLGSAATRMSVEERRRWDLEARRLYDDGQRVIDFHREATLANGPEAQAWMRRLEAEMLRWRWAAQLEPPASTDLIEAWQEAERFFATYGHAYETARTRTRLAAVLRGCGDAAGAKACADLARVAAERLGADPLLAELRLLGSTPVRSDVAASELLTPREQEILALVAEGRSNGEIAKQLYISAKTVSVHVSHILAKLGASGRTEAAAIARRQGLLTG